MQYLLGIWLVDSQNNKIQNTDTDETIRMSPRDMELLHYFLKNPDKVISLDELIESVWKGRLVGDHAIYRVINKVRKHLDVENKDSYIETIPKMGYKLVRQVELVTKRNTTRDNSLTYSTESENQSPLDNRDQSVSLKSDQTSSTKQKEKSNKKIIKWPFVFLIMLCALYSLWQKVIGPQTYIRSLNTYSSFERLLTLPGFQDYPSSSRDGKFIVFSYKKTEEDVFDVYLKNIETNEIIRITENKKNSINARVSDEAEFIFIINQSDNECNVLRYKYYENRYIEDILLSCQDNKDIDIEIDSKGEKLFYTFSDNNDSLKKIYSMHVDTGKRIQLTNYLSNQAIGDVEIAYSEIQDKLFFIRKPTAREAVVYEYDFSKESEKLVFKVDGFLSDLKVRDYSNALTYKKNLTAINEFSLRYKVEKELVSSLNERIYGYSFIDSLDKVLIVSGNEENSIWQRNINSNFGLEQLTLVDYRDSVPRFSNSSDTIAFLSDRSGQMQIWLKASDNLEYQLTRLEDQGYINWLRWSPNDRYIISTDSEKIFLIDVESGEVSNLFLSGKYKELRMPTWSSNGQDIYFSALYDSQIQGFKYNIAQQSIEKVSDSGLAAIFDNGLLQQYVVKAHRKGLWKLKNNNEKLVLPNIGSASFLQSIEFSDDGIYFIKDSTHQVFYQSYDSIDNADPAVALGIEIPNRQFSINSDVNKLIYSLTTKQNSTILVSK